MVLTKLDKRTFPFFKNVDAAATSDSYKNNAYKNLTLEVSGDVTAISLKVQGVINIEDEDKHIIDDNNLDWTNLAIIGNSDFSVLEAISGKGIYTISIAGLSKIRLVIESITGEATVVGVLEE